MKERVKTLLISGCLLFFSQFVIGCGNGMVDVGGVVGMKQYLRFTDAEVELDDIYSIDSPEEIFCNADSQTIILKIISIADPKVPYPKSLHLAFSEWDYENGDWNPANLPTEVNQPDDFYHMWTEVEDGMPVIKVSLKSNDTGEERKICAMAFSDKKYDNHLIYGEFIIYQSPENQESH